MKYILILLFNLFICNVFCQTTHIPITLGTTGPDTYADGTIVMDGEWYALIWVPNGKTFNGFNFDGTLISDSDKLITMAPLAKDGRCETTAFQLENYDDSGNYFLYLLDTRFYDGNTIKPSNENIFINGYSSINSNTAKFKDSISTSIKTETPKIDQPKIISIQIKNNIVVLKVKPISGNIGILIGNNLKSDFIPWKNTILSDSKNEIIFEIPVNKKQMFFKAYKTSN